MSNSVYCRSTSQFECRVGRWFGVLLSLLAFGWGSAASAQVVQLLPSTVLPGDRFGWSVLLHGEDLIVGAAFDDVASLSGETALDAGSAYAYKRRPLAPDQWTLRSQLIDDAPEAIDEFGFAADIVGDTLAIGVEDDGATRGGVMLFERDNGGVWQPALKVRLEEAQIEDSLGVSLDLDDDFLLVGSVRGILRDDPPSGINQPGIAHLFHRHQGALDSWGHVTPLEASDGVAGDAFGHAVSMAGDLVAVGAPGTVVRGDVGAVYLFRRHAGGTNGWGQVQRLEPADAGPGDTFGWSVELSPDGAWLVVGAPRHDGGGINDRGAVYVYGQNQDGVFELQQKIDPPQPQTQALFGFSVRLQPTVLAVGSIFGSQTGSVDLFLPSRPPFGAAWQAAGRVAPADGGVGDQFGFDVDLGDGSLVVGAPYHRAAGDEGGMVYVYPLEDVLSESCIAEDRFVHCLNGGRFEVDLTWRDFNGSSGRAKTASFRTDDAGFFWFFQPSNLEFQVKVLDGCDFNQRYWVFAAGTTNLGYTLRVTDTLRGVTATYENALGNPAPAITDTEALATCP